MRPLTSWGAFPHIDFEGSEVGGGGGGGGLTMNDGIQVPGVVTENADTHM